MRLLNRTSAYFAAILLLVIAVWAGLFYYAMLDEIYDSIDDGLDNQKGLIIQKAAHDTTVLHKSGFDETGYAIREIPAQRATSFHDVYLDTMMYMQNEKSDEPVRLLRTVFAQDGKYYRMDVATSMVEEDDLQEELLQALLWLYLGLVASIIFLNNFLLKKIWQPFYSLLRQLRAFRLEEPSPLAVSATRVQEFRELNETVSRLLQNNIASYNNQKQFIENAAHELQTPLAIATAKLEALAQQSNLTDEEGALLSSALDNVQRMARLNRSLLLLSKIENRQFGEEQAVSIAGLVQEVAEDFRDATDFKKISLLTIEEGAPVVRLNEDLARALVTNLIKNAVVHNHTGGAIRITTGADSLVVENTGAESPLDGGAIFRRFNRGESKGASTGLGLAIAKAIADLYGFRIAYDFRGGWHRMTLLF